MEQNQYAMDLLTTAKFPSPTGVNYYESSLDIEYLELYVTGFPSPTGVNYYEFKTLAKFYGVSSKGFPSPTGVNYYEFGRGAH